MDHIGIDLGGRKSQICIRREDGTIVSETKHATGKLGAYLSGLPKSRVVMETCAEAFAVADHALSLGHEVRVVPGTLVRSLGVGSRRVKTDRRDAQALSEVSCRIDLPSVHVRSPRSRELISMYRVRDVMVGSRTKAINSVRGWLRTKNQRLQKRGTRTFTKRVRELLEESGIGSPDFIERILLEIDALTEKITDATKELEAIARADETCRLLMTAPGVGALTSIRFLSALDEIGRFTSAHAVESYLGLTPGENSSSGRKQRLSITKAGPGDVRKLLVQASWIAWRTRPEDPMVRWARRVAGRRGPKIAIVAMARKLSGVLYAMWRDGRPYDTTRLARDSLKARLEALE